MSITKLICLRCGNKASPLAAGGYLCLNDGCENSNITDGEDEQNKKFGYEWRTILY